MNNEETKTYFKNKNAKRKEWRKKFGEEYKIGRDARRSIGGTFGQLFYMHNGQKKAITDKVIAELKRGLD